MRKVIKTVEVTFDEVQAFHILCEVLDIKNVVLSEEQLYIHKGKVCRKDKNGDFKVVDDRADLFAALRNVAQACGGNCEFRSDPYITHYWDGEDAEWSDCDEAYSEWDTTFIRDCDGEWERYGSCKRCGYESSKRTQYCPDCGRKMRNPD